MENIIEFDDKQNIDEQIEELESKIEKMKADKETKCEAAKKQLVDMLEVTADKYRTATGTAEALRVLRFAAGEHKNLECDITIANDIARNMATTVVDMKKKAESLPYDKMDKLCEGFYQEDFVLTTDENNENSLLFPIFDLTTEMMRIDLCRNVGGAAEDMVAFIDRVNEEIKTTEQAISDLKNQKE